MNRYRMQFAPQVWTPKLNIPLINWLRPLRLRKQRADVQVETVDVVGESIVQEQLQQGHGVMMMPNHASHADPYIIYAAADKVPCPLFIMATWHVFYGKPWLTQWLLRRHGCFSVDREANDIGAFRLATDILQKRKSPLVIFPEGEIYHCNDRVTPFREGAAAIAVAAARKAARKIVCIPCAIKYRYVADPTESLLTTMAELERAIFWRPQVAMPLEQRIYRFAEVLIAVKELEYFQDIRAGRLPERIESLREHILSGVESRQGLEKRGNAIPDRVKAARRTIIKQLEEAPSGSEQEQLLNDDLEDLFLVLQSFSYPGDYVVEKPSIDRLAETMDKFEEDVLERPTASIKGLRRASVQFGDPIEVSGDRKMKDQTTRLTLAAEQTVQKMLDQS